MHFGVNDVPKVHSGDAGSNPVSDPYFSLKSRVYTQIDAHVDNHNGDKTAQLCDLTIIMTTLSKT